MAEKISGIAYKARVQMQSSADVLSAKLRSLVQIVLRYSFGITHKKFVDTSFVILQGWKNGRSLEKIGTISTPAINNDLGTSHG